MSGEIPSDFENYTEVVYSECHSGLPLPDGSRSARLRALRYLRQTNELTDETSGARKRAELRLPIYKATGSFNRAMQPVASLRFSSERLPP